MTRMSRDTLAVFWCVILSLRLYAQEGDPWLQRSAKGKDFAVPPGVPAGVTIEVPKDWQSLSGHAEVLLAVTERTKRNEPGAAIVLERVPLKTSVTLGPALVPLETSTLAERDPLGSGFAGSIKGSRDSRLIFVQYIRKSGNGETTVTVYTFPVGASLYRLFCVAPTGQVQKYQPVFAHAAATFKATAPGGP